MRGRSVHSALREDSVGNNFFSNKNNNDKSNNNNISRLNDAPLRIAHNITHSTILRARQLCGNLCSDCDHCKCILL